MTNLIRYPSPNRLGLLKPTPWVETLTGRTIITARCYCGRPRNPRRDGTFPTFCAEHD